MNLFKITQDRRGNWKRQNLGVKWSDNGDLTPATFYLGKDHSEACKRVLLLEKMWDAIQKDWQATQETACPVWHRTYHLIALAVGRGESPIYVDLPRAGEDRPQAIVFGRLRGLFPFLDIRPREGEDREAVERGMRTLVASMDQATQMAAEMASASTADAAQTAHNVAKIRVALGVQAGGTTGQVSPIAFGEMLHSVLDAYSGHLAKKCEPDQARTQANLVKLLKSQLEDQPLTQMTADRIEAVLWFFANRPPSKHDGQPLAFYTCRNVLITFRAFLRWLNRSEAFGWELPRAFEFPRVRIKKLPADRVKKRRIFKRSELTLLWRYALPWDRALMTLALNCGFSKAEISTLQTAEVVKVKGQSYIKRERVKTDAYGEWLLWEETVAALAFLKGHRKADTPFAVVSKTGKPLDRLTRGGNENQTIKNHWDRVLKRVRADYPDFPKLPFKCLRKTGANLVRRIAKKRATELASMYLAHSERSDSPDKLLHHYTDRPWPLLHKMLVVLRRKLDGMFTSVADPWKPQRHTVSPLTLQRISELRAAKKTLEEIAAEVGLHWVTVGKYCRKEQTALSANSLESCGEV